MNPAKKITLATLGGGGLMRDVDRAFSKVCENIADPDTCTDVERKITITIRVAPDTKGQTAAICYQIKTDLAGPVPGTVIAWLAMDNNHQLGLFDDDQPPDGFPSKPGSSRNVSQRPS
jgi:hypothetical protein